MANLHAPTFTIVVALLASQASALSPAFGVMSNKPAVTNTDHIASNFFQLEEHEQGQSCCTGLFLSPDKTISFLETDGPIPKETTGMWELAEDGSLTMTIKRTFGGGQPNTDMGEFNFALERCFTGIPENIGELLGFKGKVLVEDEVLGNAHVGYFAMLATTESKLEVEGRRSVSM
mmetsp:Transcript_14182/g.23490  ORF Transcript_14182/g.23490 Transcript_14182/m.23490 type:complete len:176 (+) Transcript_14182:48-575(+)|eukprot:CAMPEP_0119014290 /NCGR_PEP_ID=MMETSP1176-20130426/9463_1 /TAXON_ID=265551 /ORGANISM="Synedropsis recta cf, Strain CCMP1620" /LENGTH=175 /DNA_ID=CAMNT_0006967445 /DNA_START=48 /DNA_END=575 /DNA_ORIENTATION=-